MKRVKRHKVKTEAPETSTSYNRDHEVHDLAYYIHDRVELMHQVFSAIKYKELKAMVPACIRNISIDDLQELCTEELLGISSKRLCAILDGAEPPSDTESSSPSPPPEQMETISLDSISSDEEILSQASSKKKKHKHRRHSKSKSKCKKAKDQDDDEADRSKASRAGLTVLELLELQARARAIRAQLQQHKTVSETASKEPPHSSDNEVEIKEEPAEVVEISSDEEKPSVEELQKQMTQQIEKVPDVPQPKTVTKRIKDLVITVPQKSKQKIKLNRTKSVTTDNANVATQNKPDSVATVNKSAENVATEPKKDKYKPRKKKNQKKKVSRDDIDNDEITLQLSDTEKMDLLEDLDRKHYDNVSSYSESSSDSESDSNAPKKDKSSKKDEKAQKSIKNTEVITEKNTAVVEKVTLTPEEVEVTLETDKVAEKVEEVISKVNKEILPSDSIDSNENGSKIPEETTSTEIATLDVEKVSSEAEITTSKPETEDSNNKTDIKSSDNENISKENNVGTENNIQTNENNTKDKEINLEAAIDKDSQSTKDKIVSSKDTEVDNSQSKDSEKILSEGELSDRESSEVEAVDLHPEVVCLSDEETNKKAKKKKKKKDKKSKKEKKSKKKTDFRESGDQNFFTEVAVNDSSKDDTQKESLEVIDKPTQSESTMTEDTTINKPTPTDEVDLTDTDNKDDIKPIITEIQSNAHSDDDIEEIYEIMELSDDSSCCEVEFILSTDPTTLEIEALSAKIDEIDGKEIDRDADRDIDRQRETDDLENIENISWKDRYLDSKKVKTVLSTANILNALRKKNRELKKKLAEESRINTEDKEESRTNTEDNKNDTEDTVIEEQTILEGSIEQYNTLEASTRYVNPVSEASKDLKKDAKLLLRMYKKLLKYNDMNKPEDPNKKKKKKRKKSKKDLNKDGEIERDDNCDNNDCVVEKVI